jgi:hypothetical protein
MQITEESMLNALTALPYTASLVKIPQLYLFDPETNTQVLEDIPGVVDLKYIFMLPTANDVLHQSLAASLGRNLGSWLRSFHSWSEAPSQASLRAEIGINEPMRRLKYLISYDSFINVLELFPDVLGDHKKSLQNVVTIAAKEFQRTESDTDNDEWGLIHGDFWTGK